MRPADMSTHEAIVALRRENSYPKIARDLGLQRRHWPALRRIVMGQGISLRVENEIRAGLDLPALLAPVLIEPCPDCGQPHTTQERCNGEPVEVVLLRPGQKVTKIEPSRQQRRPKYDRPCIGHGLNARVRSHGTSVNDIIKQWLKEQER